LTERCFSRVMTTDQESSSHHHSNTHIWGGGDIPLVIYHNLNVKEKERLK
jgi:hypothetical protein